MNIVIRQVQDSDYDGWRILFLQYLEFYEASMTEASIDLVWNRLTSETPLIRGFVAEVGGQVVGICHYHFQLSTWSETTCAYLEDLFVAPEFRSTGIARSLITRVKEDAVANAATELFWITRSTNKVAQSLYDQMARKTDFIRYEIKLEQ